MPEELRLLSLLRWKREKSRQEREQRLGEDNIDWQAIAASAESEATAPK